MRPRDAFLWGILTGAVSTVLILAMAVIDATS